MVTRGVLVSNKLIGEMITRRVIVNNKSERQQRDVMTKEISVSNKIHTCEVVMTTGVTSSNRQSEEM